MIDIITYCDNHQKILKDLYFKPSFNLYLQNSFNHIDIVYNNDLDSIKEIGFGSKVFQDMIYKRWSILIDHIKQNFDTNKVSVFSDIDIVFFGNFYDYIDNTLFKVQKTNYSWHQAQENLIDIYFMPESPSPNPKNRMNYNINAGFFIFRHSQGTLDFFQYVLDFMSQQNLKEDQYYIRKELQKRYRPNIGLLDFNIFNTNNCKLELNLSLLNRKSLKVFHATSCSDTYQKIIVLNKITNSLRDNLLNKIYE